MCLLHGRVLNYPLCCSMLNEDRQDTRAGVASPPSVFWNVFQKTFFGEHVPKNMPEGDLLVFKLSPYKTSKSPSQPGGVPPSAAGLRWIVKKYKKRISHRRSQKWPLADATLVFVP